MARSDRPCERLLSVMDSRVGVTEVLVVRTLPGVGNIFPKPGLVILFRELKFICGRYGDTKETGKSGFASLPES